MTRAPWLMYTLSSISLFGILSIEALSIFKYFKSPSGLTLTMYPPFSESIFSLTFLSRISFIKAPAASSASSISVLGITLDLSQYVYNQFNQMGGLTSGSGTVNNPWVITTTGSYVYTFVTSPQIAGGSAVFGTGSIPTVYIQDTK